MTDHFKLFCPLLIITLGQHDVILGKTWMNRHRVLLDMSTDELRFLLGRCDHLEAPSAVTTFKDVPEVNLSPGHRRTATPSKASVSSVKPSLVKLPTGKSSLSYLSPSQRSDWQYFWWNPNFFRGDETSLCTLSVAWEPLFLATSNGSHWAETEIAYQRMNAAVNLTEIEAAVSA